jgi:hypothetical protein
MSRAWIRDDYGYWHGPCWGKSKLMTDTIETTENDHASEIDWSNPEAAKREVRHLQEESDELRMLISRMENSQDRIEDDLSRKLEASRHRVAELEATLEDARIVVSRAAVEHINIQPDWSNGVAWSIETDAGLIRHAKTTYYKIIATLEGKQPNAESLAAMQELEDGGGETFASVDELMKRDALEGK